MTPVALVHAFTSPQPYNPLSYATVVEAACHTPNEPVGVKSSANVSIAVVCPVEMIRALQELVAIIVVATLTGTVGAVDEATHAGAPGGALPKLVSG